MSPLAIIKVALSGVSAALELTEGFIPAGTLKSVLEAVDAAVKEALTVLNPALAHEAGACCEALKANPHVGATAA